MQATFLTGFDGTKAIFDSYRRAWREAGRGDIVPKDRLAYAALVYTGETEAAAHAGAEKLLWYITSNKVPPHFASPPGYVPVEAGVKMLRGAEHPLSAFAKAAAVEGAIKAGIMMAGTPDQVVKQIRAVYDHVGGFGHLAQHGSGGVPGARRDRARHPPVRARGVTRGCRNSASDPDVSRMNIVTVHDVFRAAVFRLPDLEESIGPWLHALLGPPLTRLGHTVRRFSSRDDLPAAVERHGWKRDPSTWTWLFSSPEALPAVAELLAPLRAADLIVGFELTPNIIRFLTTAGLRFVEITQDSIRFCPDLFFRVQHQRSRDHDEARALGGPGRGGADGGGPAPEQTSGGL